MRRFGPIHVVDDIREGEAVASLVGIVLRLWIKAVHYYHVCLRFLHRMLHKIRAWVHEYSGTRNEEPGTWALFKRR